LRNVSPVIPSGSGGGGAGGAGGNGMTRRISELRAPWQRS
jgi:hypothetical protein